MRDLRDYQHLPNIILRSFGINHCFWGVIILILGFVELGITANDVEDYWNPTTNRWKTFAYYAPASLIFGAILVINIGFFFHLYQIKVTSKWLPTSFRRIKLWLGCIGIAWFYSHHFFELRSIFVISDKPLEPRQVGVAM